MKGERMVLKCYKHIMFKLNCKFKISNGYFGELSDLFIKMFFLSFPFSEIIPILIK